MTIIITWFRYVQGVVTQSSHRKARTSPEVLGRSRALRCEDVLHARSMENILSTLLLL